MLVDVNNRAGIREDISQTSAVIRSKYIAFDTKR